MKPITTTNPEGRALLALRAGPMTMSEVNARIGTSLPGWLIKAGYVALDESGYRITEAGRAACPYRNPLAAPGVVPPARYSPEIEMPRETRVTRQQVLAVIQEAGAAGINKADLIAKFEHLAPADSITAHLVMLKKDAAVSNPSRGLWVTTAAIPAPTAAAVAGLASQIVAAKEMTLDAKITEILVNASESLSARQIRERMVNPPDSETLTREIYLMKTAGRLEHDPLATPPAGSRGNVGMYRLVTEKDYKPKTVVIAPAIIRAPQDSQAIKDITSLDGFKVGDTLPGGELEIVAMPESLAATLADLGLDDLERPKVRPEAIETIEIKGVEAHTAPLALVIEDEEDFEVGIFSDGSMTVVMEDGLQDAVIEFCPAAVKKMRRFFGLFQEEA